MVLFDSHRLKPNACLYTLTITKQQILVHRYMSVHAYFFPLACATVQRTTELRHDKKEVLETEEISRDFAGG
jgi:hypothetical protein